MTELKTEQPTDRPNAEYDRVIAAARLLDADEDESACKEELAVIARQKAKHEEPSGRTPGKATKA